MHQNQLSGTLPEAWSSLTALTGLSLSQNQLWGTLPAAWSSLTALTELEMGQNNLSGSVPISWRRLGHLSTIDLSRNQLSGSITDQLSSAWLQLSLANLSSNELTGRVPAPWLSCSSTTPATVDLHNNKMRNTRLDEVSARSLIGCRNLSVNLCGNRDVFNATTVRELRSMGLWENILPLLFPGNCWIGSSVTASRLTATRTSAISLISAPPSGSASEIATRSVTTPISSSTPTVTSSCPVLVGGIVLSITLQFGSLSGLEEFVSSSAQFASTRTRPSIPVESFVATAASRQAFIVRAKPVAGFAFKGLPRNVSASIGVISSAVLNEDGDVWIVVAISGSVGTISLASSSAFEVTLAIEAGGPCLDGQGHWERISALWTIAALPPPSSLYRSTMTTFRWTTVISSAFGHPLHAMTATGLVSILSLEECMFSDVDPLDPSVSPFTSAAIGPTVGQYYRGAVVVALSLYSGVAFLALCGAMLLWQQARTRFPSCAPVGRYLSPHFATLHFPSVGVLVVGVFGQGLATCGMSLIRLDNGTVDVVLGVVSLLVCIVLAVLAATVTTAWLQARVVKQKPTARRGGWAGIFLSYSTWRSHWQDSSRGLQFKRRYMLLLDDMQRPWWTAVEMSSSCFQGCVLGLRINSVTACRGQLWALTAHCVAMFGGAVYFRPCGAVLSNVFLVLSKLGAVVISLLLLLRALTLDERFAQAAQVVTSISTAIATAQVVAQIVSAVLLVHGTPRNSLLRILSRALRKGDHPEKSGCDRPLELSMGMISDDHAAEDLNTRRQAIFGDQREEVAGAIVRREVMLQLLRALDSNTPSDERLVRLLQAAIAQRQSGSIPYLSQ